MEYAIVTNEQESYEQCTAIFNGLVKNGYVKDPEVAKKEILQQLKPGMSVMAQFTEDSYVFNTSFCDKFQ